MNLYTHHNTMKLKTEQPLLNILFTLVYFPLGHINVSAVKNKSHKEKNMYFPFSLQIPIEYVNHDSSQINIKHTK